MRRNVRDLIRVARDEGFSVIEVSRRGCGHYAVTVEVSGRRATVSASSTPSCAGWIHAFRRKLRREMDR